MRVLFTTILVLSVHLSLGQTQVFNIYFPNDLYGLDQQDSSTIQQINEFTSTHHVLRMYILGYCDDHGTDESNAILSERRAQVVADLIDSSQLIVLQQGRGSIGIEPESSISIDSQRYLHRRTEVSIVYDSLRTAKPPDRLTADMRVGQKLVLDDLHFYGSRHVVLPSSQSALDRLLEQLLQYPAYEVEIQGHVCCTEDADGYDEDTQTMDLSVQRAMVIRDYLIGGGVDADRLTYRGYGSSQRTGAIVPADRRVEIEITGIREAESE